MTESIWTKNAKIPPFPRLEGELQTDVLIVGGGMAGLLCARELTRDGVDCALIESDRILRGVSRNTTAKITSQHGLIYSKLVRRFGPEMAHGYWQANEKAKERLCELALEADCGLERKDSYVYATDDLEPLVEEMAALDRAGIYGEYAEDLPLPFPVAGAIRFSNQAQFDPLRFGAYVAKGLRIYENTEAIGFAGNKVVTESGAITASKIIIATHFPILNKHGAYFLKLYQQRSYVLALENAGQVEGMYLGIGKDALSFRNYGDVLLLGGGGHRTGKKGGGWEPLERFSRKYYPDARQVCRWATQDCMSLDGLPYIGPYSRATPDLYAATGFNKWGMTSSMVAAELLRDMVQGRQNPFAEIFAPSRSILRPQLLCNGAEAVANLLTPTKPRCPHMGCALKWNPREHSWDCPCHGSRFDTEGRLMDNSATGDLRRPVDK